MLFKTGIRYAAYKCMIELVSANLNKMGRVSSQKLKRSDLNALQVDFSFKIIINSYSAYIMYNMCSPVTEIENSKLRFGTSIPESPKYKNL